ncbi:MAG: tyrosine-type recombinase/integrase [Leptospirillum sp.]|jgi:site-specific recombinase XerD
MGPHILRHTFATRQFEAAIPPAIVKNWMGHSSLITTLIYEHVSIAGGSVKPV